MVTGKTDLHFKKRRPTGSARGTIKTANPSLIRFREGDVVYRIEDGKRRAFGYDVYSGRLCIRNVEGREFWPDAYFKVFGNMMIAITPSRWSVRYLVKRDPELEQAHMLDR